MPGGREAPWRAFAVVVTGESALLERGRLGSFCSIHLAQRRCSLQIQVLPVPPLSQPMGGSGYSLAPKQRWERMAVSRPLLRRGRPQGLIPWGTDALRGSRHLPNTPSFTPPPCPMIPIYDEQAEADNVGSTGPGSPCEKQGWDSHPTEPAWKELRPVPACHLPPGPSLQDSRLEPKQGPHCMALVPRAEGKEPADATVTAHLYPGLHPLLAPTT